MIRPHTEAKVWVYGSLMEGFYNYQKALVGQIEERVPAWIYGRLYHQTKKGYPAILPGEDRIYGELLTILDFQATIEKLDMIEDYRGDGYRNEYERKITSVIHLKDEKTESAYVYWYGWDDIDTPENPSVYIPSGDWREYMKAV